MRSQEIEKAIERVKANFALEDMMLTEEEIQNCEAILNDEISVEELIEKRKNELAAQREKNE